MECLGRWVLSLLDAGFFPGRRWDAGDRYIPSYVLVAPCAQIRFFDLACPGRVHMQDRFSRDTDLSVYRAPR